MTGKKIYILDTNIFLNDPKSLNAFPGEVIKIPLEVIEEIDDQKRRVDDVGRAARQTSRMLDELRAKGNLSDGVMLDNGCMVYVEFGDLGLSALPTSLRTNKEDNRILATALCIKRKNTGNECFFITKDINMRIKADTIGITTMDFEIGKIEYEELYQGYTELSVTPKQIADFRVNKKLEQDPDEMLLPNEFAVLACEENGDTEYGRLDSETNLIVPLKISMDSVIAGIKPLNPEQVFAFELLLDDEIKLVTLNGRAGTGKTLLALAAGCHTVLETENFEKLLISRPVIPMGKDIGFLPGSIEEKMDPWMVPLFDNLDLIFSLSSPDKKKQKRNIRELIESTNAIQVEPLTYIRGRSLPDQYMIIDEAQNLSPHEVKTIITRAGKNTKVVLTGDPYQIDHPYLDINSNGLNYVIERFKESSVAGHVTMIKGERSELAELAAELL